MRLRTRDYFVVPALSLLTIFFLFGTAELAARMLWEAHEGRPPCREASPNCSYSEKTPEGPWVRYAFNECGYRSDSSCGSKADGVFRLVMMGSSTSEGLGVRYEETFAARTQRGLEKELGRKVELENLAVEGLNVLQSYTKLGEAIALKPDVIVFGLAPFDLETPLDPSQLARRNEAGIKFNTADEPLTQMRQFQLALKKSRAVTMAQHFFFSNTETYARLYLERGSQSGYLREPLSPAWKKNIADFGVLLKDMAERTKAAHIPLVVLVLPSRAQAALLSLKGAQPAGIDIFAFDNAIQKLAAEDKVGFIDATQDFGQVPHSEELFYIVDSHLNGEGHALVAKALLSGRLLSFCVQLRPAGI